MTLHPQTRAALAAERREPLTPGRLPEFREQMEKAAAAEVGPPVMVPVVTDFEADGVPVRLYDPRYGHGAPVVVYLHAGGWVAGSLATGDGMCRRIADRSGCAVLSVGYRRAPEHPWPAALEDAERAVAWLRSHASDHGVDASVLAVFGESAGGHLAAVLARRARDAGQPYRFQVLVYPMIDPELRAESHQRYAEYGLDGDELRFYWESFLPAGADRAQPDVNPANAELAGLPPALVITAEYDVLRDEVESYAHALLAADVPVVLARYQGVNHGFFRKLAQFDAARIAVDSAAAALRDALS
jgi:acetyl esterase